MTIKKLKSIDIINVLSDLVSGKLETTVKLPVNGFNLGRFYNSGPTLSLYIPGPLLKKGNNQIVIFETEGIVSDSINLVDKPIFKKDMNNN